MSDSWFNNLDTREKANALDAIGRSQSLVADYVNITGDTMTGLLAGTTLAMTGNASLATADIPTITGAAVAGSTLAMTGLATLSSAFIPTLTATSPVFTSTASMATARIYSTIATEAALTLNQTLIGGASIATLNIVASGASQAFISFSGAFLSSASYGGTASTNAFVIPVYHESQRVFGYISAQKALV